MNSKLLAIITTLALAIPLFGVGAMAQEDSRKVDINVAGVDELEELPGIGEKVAARIVSYREENGPFEAPEEIMNVRGIGEKTYLKLEAYLTVSKAKRPKK